MNSFLSFPEIADKTAQKKHGGHWQNFVDDYLSDLARDFWLNRFAEVFDEGPSGNYPEPIKREYVWKILGRAKPLSVRSTSPDEFPPWDILADAKSQDYGRGSGLRNTALASLLLSESEANDWIEKHCSLRGRKTDAESEASKILEAYDQLCDNGNVSFERGGLAQAVRDLAPIFPSYKTDSIRRIIQATHNEQKLRIK